MKKIKLDELNKLTTKDFGGIIKIIPTQLLESLENTKLPLKKERSIIQICNFLSELNLIYSKSGKSILVLSQSLFINSFSRDTYKKYQEILSTNNIITQVSYENGIGYDMNTGIAKQYRLHNSYLNNNDYTILLFDNIKIAKDINIEINLDINYINTICNEELDYEKVFNTEYNFYKSNNTTLFSLYSRISRALHLNTSRYIKNGTKVNRIYHSYSNLSRETRKCFKTKFNNIDLKNSQPILLVYYLKSNNINLELEYQKVCEDGKLYEEFYNLFPEIKDEELLRTKVKTTMYESLFFAFNINRKINKRFKELYPLVWNALKELNEKNITLASILQNIEADIFNNLTIKYSKKYFTLFDAIYFNDKRDIIKIENQLNKMGEKYNINFSLSINK